LGRRSVVNSLAGASIALPYFWTRRAQAAQQLTVRTPGGAYDEVKRATVYEPFRKATGIEIIPVAATVAKLLAMHRSGQMEVDLIDTGDDVLLQLDQAGALAPLDLKAFKRTNPDDIEATVKHKTFVGSFNYAMLMGYHTAAYPKGKEPKSWAEFWDIKAFPGPRTLADMASGAPDLEFALLADGVPMDNAIRSTSAGPSSPCRWFVRHHQVLGYRCLVGADAADKEVVLAALWSTRLGVGDRQGAPLGAQWNQNAVLGQAYGIPIGSKNAEAAFAFIDFSLSPEIQADWLKPYKAIPVNQKAYPATAPELLDPETKLPCISAGMIVWMHPLLSSLRTQDPYAVPPR